MRTGDPKLWAKKQGISYYEYITKPAADDYIPNEKEQDFIYEIVENGKSAPQAHIAAGYSEGTAKDAYIRAKRLAPQIHRATRARLTAGAPLAIHTLIGLMKDEEVAPSVRVKAAAEVLDRAGYPKQVSVDFGGESKQIDELTRDELAARIQSKLRDKAKVIESKSEVIEEAQIIDMEPVEVGGS